MKHHDGSFALGSKNRDLLVFVLVLGCILATLSRLEVYHRASPHKVSLKVIATDGSSHTVELPPEMQGIHRKQYLLNKIHDFSNSPKAAEISPSGEQLEWTLHYSRNSLSFDQQKVIITKAASKKP